jgi:hypothetical protein
MPFDEAQMILETLCRRRIVLLNRLILRLKRKFAMPVWAAVMV